MLDMAYTYHTAGFNVIPLAPRSKVPLAGFNLAACYAKRLTMEQLRAFPRDCNIGLVMGHTKGDVYGFAALDIDGEEAAHYLRDCFFTLQNKGDWVDYEGNKKADNRFKYIFAWSMRTLTGSGGRHVVFRYPVKDFQYGIDNQDLWRGLIDHSEIKLLGTHKHVVAAPSIHPNGNAYVLSEHTGYHAMPVNAEDIDYMISRIKGKKTKAAKKAAVERAKKIALETDPVPDVFKNFIYHYLDTTKIYSKQGGRHGVIMHVAGECHKNYFSEESTKEFVIEICARYDDEEVSDRLRVVSDTFKKDRDDVAGLASL